MAVIESWFDQDLTKAVKVQYLDGNVFSADNQGNKVGVRVFQNGEAASLSGTISANIIRADGATVTQSGSFSGNEASVILPQSAYAVPGVISIIIKNTVSSVITTLCAVVATVYESTTSTIVDPGTIIPSVQALIDQIDTAVASIPAEYSSLWTSLAPAFNPSRSGGYKAGEFCTNDGAVYICTVDHTGSWNSSHFAVTNLGDQLTSLKSAIDALAGTYVTPSPTETNAGYYSGTVGSTISYSSAANSSGKKYNLSSYVGKKVVVKATTSGTGSSPRITALCDSSGKIAKCYLEKTYTQDGLWFDIDSTNCYLYVSYQIYLTSDVSVQVLTDIGRVGTLENEYESIDNSLDGVITVKTPMAFGTAQNGYYTGNVGDTIALESANNSRAYVIDLSDHVGEYVRISATTTATTSGRVTALCNSSGKIAAKYTEKEFVNGDMIFYVTETNYKLYLSFNYSQTTNISVVSEDYGQIDNLELRVDRAELREPVYVSTTGSDGNDGSYAFPFKTIAHALSVSNNIVLFAGTYSGETISIDGYDYGEISIKGQEAQSVIINFGSTFLVDDGSERKEDGYEKVYSVTCPTFPFAEGATKARMYQDYVPDASTEISASDRHPLQRGRQYRCDSTIIKQCNSIAAIDALPSGQYGFYWNNGTMYFSRPQTSSASHPIVIPQRDTYFINQYLYRTDKKQCKIVLNNIEVRYACIHLSYSANHEISDVSVKYPYVSVGGCFFLYNVTNCELNRCEACSVTSGAAIGDGFNVDTDDTVGNSTAVSLTARLVDCWSHDNNDDGYSDHERSEVTLLHSLFEYNGKGGITPAYGANDIVIDCVSRYNAGAGILSTGNPTENTGRKKTTVYAEGCVCYGQVNGFYAPETETIIQAVNCISYGNTIGYNGTSGHIYAVNCKSNDTNAKSGNVTIQTVNDLA